LLHRLQNDDLYQDPVEQLILWLEDFGKGVKTGFTTGLNL